MKKDPFDEAEDQGDDALPAPLEDREPDENPEPDEVDQKG
jgi:hypothetical protein